MVAKAICCGILQKSAPCFHVTKATKQWRIVEIELLKIVGWKCGCQPSAADVDKMWHTAEKRFLRHVCPNVCLRSPCLLWNQSLHSACKRQRVEVSKIWTTGCWLWSWLFYICDCCKSMKNCQDWAFSSSGFGSGAASLSAADHGVVVSKICYVWSCSQLCDQTAAKQRTVVEIELLATVGWKRGCQPFSYHVGKMCRTAESRYARHVCVRHPFRPFHFGIPSIQSLPEAGSWERQ